MTIEVDVLIVLHNLGEATGSHSVLIRFEQADPSGTIGKGRSSAGDRLIGANRQMRRRRYTGGQGSRKIEPLGRRILLRWVTFGF